MIKLFGWLVLAGLPGASGAASIRPAGISPVRPRRMPAYPPPGIFLQKPWLPGDLPASVANDDIQSKWGSKMQERELRAFVAIAEIGRMDLAAKKLGYSQPAISYQIICLERSLGIKLFTRSSGGTTLTREGHTILPTARATLMLIDNIKKECLELGRTPLATLA
ncbi:LysR family transcriptional regulator [Streptomyces anulatus]|uniref:LysR family transcriptional regulator n=1 Tax=Streptomyces anulatus TaxID=1892 RepID=UPI0033E082BE